MRKRPYTPEELDLKRAKNRAYMVGYFQRNKERILIENKKYRMAHPDRWIEYQKKYVLAHPERVKASKKAWIKNHPEKVGQWDKRNPQRRNEIKAAYKKRNPITNLQNVLRSRILLALKSQGLRKHKRTVEMVGCTIDELMKHLESKFTVGMTWTNRGFRGWHIDHIKPLSLFDLRDEAQQKLAFH